MEQIRDWLEKLGLGQYAKLFVDNDIDVSVLPHLTDEDLKNLGISLGHRRKIFAGINEGFGCSSAACRSRETRGAQSPRHPRASLRHCSFLRLGGFNSPINAS